MAANCLTAEDRARRTGGGGGGWGLCVCHLAPWILDGFVATPKSSRAVRSVCIARARSDQTSTGRHKETQKPKAWANGQRDEHDHAVQDKQNFASPWFLPERTVKILSCSQKPTNQPSPHHCPPLSTSRRQPRKNIDQTAFHSTNVLLAR